MATKDIRIEPGGQYSDLVETALAKNQHHKIVNLRQEKIGEWECVKGYKEVLTGFTNIKAAIEITDDLSGDRFFLIQDGTGLKRVDYDISNSPDFGYENETPSTISLPGGVTIGANAILRFFYFRGIVRISGASTPLWYGYIDRTIFPNSWSTKNLDDFNSGVDGWAGSSATVVQEAVSPLLEGAGCLQVDATADNGYAYKAFTVTIGTKYKFFIKGYKGSGQVSVNLSVLIGTTQGGAEITTLAQAQGGAVPTDDDWNVFEHEFTATTTTIYIALTPIDDTDYAHWDYALLRENHQIVLQDWYIYEASLNKPTDSEIGDIDAYTVGSNVNSAGILVALAGFGLGYDKSQFSLVAEDISIDDLSGFTFSVDDYANALGGGTLGAIKFDITLPHDLDKYRITSVFLAIYYSIGEQGILNPKPGDYNIHDELDITEEYEDGWIFTKANFHTDAGEPKRLELTQAGDEILRWWDGLFRVGQRIRVSGNRLSGVLREIDTIITYVFPYGLDDDLWYIEVLDDVDQLGAHGDLPAMGVWLEKIWEFTAGVGYKMRSALEVEGAGEGFYPAETDTPSGTKHNTPDYSHHVVIEERAYVASKEDEEEDAYRYSPLLQFDNFPIGNLTQTQVGDIDSTRAIVNRDSRLVALKRNSLSQGNFIGGQYYEDIGLHDSGLYADFGYKVVDNVLYYMDKEEVYAFYGGRPIPLLQSEMQRKTYRENVDENSLIFHDKLNNEIWFILKGSSPATILVFHPERKEWYTRVTDITPITSFLGYDKKMLVAAVDKIVTYNHDETEFDESICWSILTKVWLKNTAEFHMKCNKVYTLMKGNKEVTVTTRDPEITSIETAKTFTPNVHNIRSNRVSPKLNIKMLEFLLATSASVDQQATIQAIEAEVEVWK